MRIGGSAATRRHLESLGLVDDAVVCVIADHAGDLVVRIRGARVGLAGGIAGSVYGYPCAEAEECK